MEKKLHRDEHRKLVGGVCAGLAEYFDIDVTIVRLVFVASLVLKGGGGLIYIILWIVLPKKGYMPPVDYTVPPTPGTPYQSASPFQSGSPFQSANPYQQPVPAFVPPKKHPTTAALIGGLVMILLGAGFLLDSLDIVPDWDFEKWWPLILIVIGVVLIFTRSRNHQTATWQVPQQPVAKETEQQNDNPQTEL